jgi:hypothetical protein
MLCTHEGNFWPLETVRSREKLNFKNEAMENPMRMKCLSTLIPFFLAGNVFAHEVNMDSALTPREEVAGLDVPPYSLNSYYEGEAGDLFGRSGCYVSQEKLRSYSIGEWMEHRSIEDREKLVCAIILLSGGPQRLLNSGARAPHPDFLRNATLGVFVLSETFRAPYNLSAVEAISGTLVILGGLSPSNRRALLRTVLE